MCEKLGKSVSRCIRKTKSMSSNPLVSIIIPIYKVEKYLRQCLDSVLAQTYSNWEMILVDDGSPDCCPAICDEYAERDKRVTVLHCQNGGQSRARNRALDCPLKGDFVTFLDSDDYLSPTCIEELLKASENGQLAMTGYILEWESTHTFTTPEQAEGSYPDLYSYLLDFHRLFATKFNFAWGKLYRRDIIEEHYLRFVEGLRLAEDVLFNLEYYNYCDKGINAIESKGYYYRQSDGSTQSKKFDPKMFDWNETAYCAVRDYLVKHDAMTAQNKNHFYSNVLGNLFYSTDLLSLQNSENLSVKRELISKYASTELARETYIYATPKGVRSRLMKFFLKHRMVNTYIFANQLIQSIKKIIR